MLGTMAAAGAALVALTAAAGAQNWPTRPITLVVPFAAFFGVLAVARPRPGQTMLVSGAAAGPSSSTQVQ